MFNNNTTRRIAFSLTLIGGLAIASPLFAMSNELDPESARQINAANQLLREGELDQAIAGYSEVVTNQTNRDELNYNTAVAQYRKSDIGAASSLFNETACSGNSLIAARSRFNLGNCQYANALQLAEKDKPAAIKQLRQAILHYRGALLGMPDKGDARANIELATRLIRNLEEEQKQEDQKQDQQNQDQLKQDQQNQDQQKQDQQNQDQQKQDQQKQDGQNQDGQNQSDQDSDSQDPQQQEQPDQSNSDQPHEKSERENKSEQESQQPQSQGERQRQPIQHESSQSQTNDRQSLPDESELDEQSSDQQPVPTGELTAADEQDEQKSMGSVAMAGPDEEDEAMTHEEALKMLQAVRDRDMLRRLQQQQRERSRHIPVDRNW